jgi:hypothetical protein
MPVLTTYGFFFFFFLLAEDVPYLVDFHFPVLTMIQFIFCHRVTKFVTCVGIARVRLGEPSIHNHILKERRCRRGRP